MKPIPVNTPALTAAERQSVLECLDGGWISSEGPQVAAFEAAFAGHCQRQHGIAVSSGTAALDIAVRALGLGPGDEVLVPSFTIVSCGRAVVESGARLVPVDCDAEDWNAHLRHFESRVTSRTRAIMIVHLYGLCGDLGPLLDWARDRQLLVIEDASQAVGLSYRGRPCGSFGDVSVFSLYANKLITTGEGGIVLCDSSAVAERSRALRNLCFETTRRFWHEDLGWNYRMTAMQAALGLPQLARVPALVQRKRVIADAYRRGIGTNRWLRFAPPMTEHAENVYWAFGVVVDPEGPFSREALTSALSARGIGWRPFFHGLHVQPALLKTGLIDAVPLEVTERLAATGFYLPSGLGLSESEIGQVVAAITEFLRERE